MDEVISDENVVVDLDDEIHPMVGFAAAAAVAALH